MAAQLHTEGRQFMLEVCFSEEQSVPANFYVGLCTDTSIAENAALSALGEITSTDYARHAAPSASSDFTSAATGTNDRKITLEDATFTASTSGVTWTKVESWFLATSSDDSGKLIASGPLNCGSGWTLSAPQTLTFDIEMTFPG